MKARERNPVRFNSRRVVCWSEGDYVDRLES